MFGCLITPPSYHHGDPSDYDEWARLAGEGAESWEYKDFYKSADFSVIWKRTNRPLTL